MGVREKKVTRRRKLHNEERVIFTLHQILLG